MATLPRPAEPSRSPSLEVLESSTFHVKPKRLLDVSDVAEWLGILGCVVTPVTKPESTAGLVRAVVFKTETDSSQMCFVASTQFQTWRAAR
jgi:hypothetical protein